MEITKSQKRLFILLGIVLIYAVYDFVANKDTYLAVYTGQRKAAIEKKIQHDSNKPLKKQELTKTTYLEKWGRDPFYKQVNKRIIKKRNKKKRVRFILQAVSMKQNSSIAIINDKIVKVNDIISGYTVKKIEKKRAILSDGNKTIILKLATFQGALNE